MPMQSDFDINRPRDDGKAAARLPTLGGRGLEDMPAYKARSVDEYITLLHGAIDDAANVTKGSLVEAAKALGAAPPQAFSYSSMSFMPDPTNYGLMQWPGLNPESLRKICRENIAPIVIIRQRVSDLMRYSQISTNLWQPGWEITMRDPQEEAKSADRKSIEEATKFIYNCSMDGDKDPRDRDANLIPPFSQFLASFGDDSLTFDAWAIWTDMEGSGDNKKVRSFANLPAGMIRLAIPTKGYKGNPKYFAAMVDETGNPIKPFTRDELIWRVRNVRNDPSVMGYGWPEPEMAIRLIQGFQGGVDLNVDAFQRNGLPNGIMLLKGDYFNQEQIDAMTREWTNMKRGVSKLWGMPVIAVPEDGDVEIVPFMDMKGDDVRYKDHMNLMMGVCCLVWCFPVRRLGMFVSGHHKDNAPTQDQATEIQGADDPGLPPLLIHIEETLNPYLLWPRWPNLRFRFMAKNPKEDARQIEMRRLARTWGEARREANLPPLTKLASADMKPLAEIMELAPEDTVKASAFQTIAVKMLEAALGLGGEGGDGANKPGGGGKSPANPGAPMMRTTDPATKEDHGHTAGTRRDSRAEKDSAATKTSKIQVTRALHI